MKIRTLLAVAFAAISVPVCAQQLVITAGVADHQVFQRASDSRAVLRFQGTAAQSDGKNVEARLEAAGRTLTGFDWQPVGKVGSGAWSAEVPGVPVGGPYTLEVRVAGGTDVARRVDLLVGDLWVLAGQSNMEGVGNLENVQQPDPRVHSFDMTDQWVLATEPLHRLWDAVDSFHWRRNNGQRMTGKALDDAIAKRVKGAGLGLTFAVEMVRRTGVPVGLLPCAHGGTSMDQWSPELRDQGGASLYGGMIRRIRAAGGAVTGVLWYQGESDANPKAAPEYKTKFENLIGAVRRDTGVADLPFYFVQIGRFVNHTNLAEWNHVQEMQRQIEASTRRTGMVAAVDLSLDDAIHVGTDDLKRLGRRMANLALRDLFPNQGEHSSLQAGPRPVSAVYRNGAIRVEFSGVNGRLQAPGRVGGFSIRAADGSDLPLIYRSSIDVAAPYTVVLKIQGQIPEGARLHYGYGKDPFCNVRDSRDMALPVFGPMAIE